MRLVTFAAGIAVGVAVKSRFRGNRDITRTARRFAERPEVQQAAGVVAVQAGVLVRAARESVLGVRTPGDATRVSTVPPSFAPPHLSGA